jgi:two-component system probable response regulator PhcQ
MNTAAPDDRYAVLFVDDEEKARKYFRMAFARDFMVLVAANVQEALEILGEQGERIAILITDQRMPGQQGVDLLKRARADWPQIVRMLTTAYSDLDDAIAAVNRGEILRYITKPWDLDVLRAELKHGMEFFELRLERDKLLDEKLSVRFRSSQADRLRGLLAIAAGLSNLRNGSHAVSAWARGVGVAETDQVPHKDLELWGLEVRQTRDLIALHRRLRELDAIAAGGFPDLTSPRALLVEQGCGVVGEGRMIQANRALLERLIAVLRPYVTDRVSLGGATGGGIGAPGSAVDLVFDTQGDGLDAAAESLLAAHLIAWHHGGAVQIERSAHAGSVRVTLSADPLSAEIREPDATWIADQFSLLEP